MECSYSLEDFVNAVSKLYPNKIKGYDICTSLTNSRYGLSRELKDYEPRLRCEGSCLDCPFHLSGEKAMLYDLNKLFVLNRITSVSNLLEETVCRSDCTKCQFNEDHNGKKSCVFRNIKEKIGTMDENGHKKYVALAVAAVKEIANKN